MKKLILITMLVAAFSFVCAAQYDFNPTDSPTDEYGNTYDDLGWTDIVVSQTDVLTGIQIAYTWDTDSWEYEGSFWIESPDGDVVEIASGEFDGTYSVTLDDFNGEAMYGTWLLYIEDSYGDGGHQATDITVSFLYAPAGSPDLASNPSPAHMASNVALTGNLTWDFGAYTDTYDLWFGPVGSMTQKVFGASAGATGTYAYSSLLNDTQYSWRIDTISSAKRITTTGATWTFTTAFPEGMVQIGAGTSTSLNLPLNPYFGYNYSQTLYLQSEIDISGQRIEKLYYNWNGYEAGTNLKDWTIYMGHTAKTAFASTSDWVPVGDMTQVFSGVVTIPASAGWIEITLNTPFGYNNSDNLVIAVNETTPSYASSSAKFYGTSFVANRGLLARTDGSAYNPASPGEAYGLVAGIANIKMLFGDLPANPIFGYSPTALAFPITRVTEASSAQNVSVTNIGVGTLELGAADLSLSGDDAADFSFSVINLPADLEASQSVNIPVTFQPTSAGAKTANLVITYNSVEYTVVLSGYAYAETALIEGFEGAFPPLGWGNLGSWSKSTYTYYEGAGSAYKSPYDATPYILSTPKLELVAGSTLVFMGRISSIATALDIVYSTDRTTWTKLGESIFAPTANTWFQNVIDLSAIGTKAGSYYLGFRTMGSGSYYIDNVIMPPAVIESPEAVTLNAPTDAATNVGIFPTLSWTPAATGGIPTSYDIYLEATTAPVLPESNPTTLWDTVPASPYTLTTPLDYSTTYIWKVVAKNDAKGDSPDSAVRSFTTMDDPTVYTLPFTEGFEDGNTNATAINGWFQEGITGTSQWTANDTETDRNRSPRTGDWNAYLRWGNTRWMFKPVQLDAGVAYKATVYARQDGATASNASIGISYGTEPSAAGMTESIMAPTGIINGDYQGLEGVFTPATDGIYYVGILGTINSTPYYISIDDITIELGPTDPIFAIDPTEKAFGTVSVGTSASQTFTISNQGGGTMNVQSISL
ncbi:MAG: choice-of-anchor D domain-containing protein, partial [Candidatus Cloacimonetes bacterium]|nr:choice-of-anchor D domain-containing protein [Candidatus Cloacimonadota bacterium]MDY0228774.1 choice-of-anchor D domain-containing protein [Candidatus Cloacimonadaceae bacterium]